MRNVNVLKGAKRLTAVLLALVMILGLVPQAFAAGQARSTETQTSSPEETVYVNSYGGSTREVDFSDHWRFNLGSGSAAKEYNDSAWRDVDLPHDYSIEQSYTTSGEAESGYLPGGTGWYRKTFTLSPEWEGKYITIDFGGVYMNATVYLNGGELGFHPYGYTAFSFELPQNKLNFEGENVIAVEVEHQTPSSRWYSGSGIYRTVHLTVTDPVHVTKDGVYVTTPNLKNDSKDGTMEIETVVENTSAVASEVTVRQTLYKQGATAAAVAGFNLETSKSIPAGERITVEQTGKIDNPDLWSPDSPNLYTLKTEVLVGDSVVDTCETEFGFRWTNFNSTNGFELNGEPTKLKGVCMHHDQGSLGSEAWYRAIERQVEILKEMGCNAIRVTHNPAAPELIEIANEKGIMLIDEAFDTWVMPKNGNVNDYSAWFEKTIGSDNAILGGDPDMTWAEFDIKAMVNQDKNSPAVIMYSLGNEIFEGTSYSRNQDYPLLASKLCTWVQEIDSTRKLTFGDNKLKSATDDATPIAKQVAAVIANNGGIVGYNYSTIDNLNDGAANNGWLVYHSETASAVNSRGIYDRKASNGDGGKGDYLLTSYDKSAVGWGAVASDAWWRTITDDNSTGEFVWTGFDYIGEPTPWNGTGSGAIGTWPSSPKSSYFGIIDTNGLPKDSYYFYQSQWNEDVTTLHLLPTWNRSDVVFGSKNDVEVVVYSDAPVIKLYLNGDEVGTATSTLHTTDQGYTYRTWTGDFDQNSDHQSLYATFWVPYAEGRLEVKAFQADGITPISGTKGRSYVETTSAATQLTMEADRTSITADGDDLSYITISVKDQKGNLINTDDVSIQLSIEGNGKIIGVDNGRQPDHTSYQSLTRNTGAGQLVAVVQSTDKAGSFTVTATTADGLSSNVTVKTVASDGGSSTEKRVVSYQISRNHYVKLGSTPELPAEVTATYSDGSTAPLEVNWNNYDSSLIQKPGSFFITGTLGGTSTTVSVTITMLDTVAALLNYSAAVQVDGAVTLPSSRPGVLADGTILDAEFPVTWDQIPADFTETAGTKTIKGTSTVFGQELDVTATIRVAAGTVTIGGNVAPNAAELTQDIPPASQSDTLEAIRNGSNEPDANNDGGDNPAQWSNFKWANDQNQTTSSLTFRYDTAQYLGEVVIHYNTDFYSAALPSSVKMEVSGNGELWTELNITAGAATKPYDSVHTIPYTFAPVDAVFFRVTFTNKVGDPPSNATAYCVAITELELKVAQTSFPIFSTADLTGLTVNGKEVDANSLANHTYSTEALVLASLTVSTNANVAYTVLPAHENVVRILTESEDHSTRGNYVINLASEPVEDPEDDSRDYDYTKTTATAPSYQPADSGNEDPINFAIDNNRATFWHTAWGEDLREHPEKRYIQLTLEEATLLDALRYQPRPTVANGIVTKYRVEVSTDGQEWTTVSQGDWAHDTTWKIAVFNEPTEAKYVRLYGEETRGGVGDQLNKFMSCAELRVRVAKTTTDLSSATVTVEPAVWHYTGDAITPDPVVTLNGNTLRKGVDYTVSYSNNTEVGTATVTVTGMIDYSGTATGTFEIKNAWMVTFMDSSAQYEQAVVTDGQTVTAPTAPTKEGYTFTGWYTDEACQNAYEFSTPVTDNLTLYAGWEKNEEPITEWAVTFMDGNTQYAQAVVTDGQTVAAPTAPAKEGYTFTGWYTDEACTTAYDFNTPIKEDLTLYAGWEKNEEPIAKWTVTFMSNGTTYKTLTVENDQSVSKPSNPTRPGYTFTGWYLDKTCTIPYRFDAAVTGDLTLYAGWKRDTTDHKPVNPVDPIKPVEPDVPTFTDVKATDWYSEAVSYAVDAGLMNGTGGGKFSPQATTTRGMLMTVLARMDGVDTTGGADWYTKGMEWAKRGGVSGGTNPELPITREQLAAMLYRYAGSPAVGSYTLNFRDADKVSDWALDAMRWAVKNGVVSGKGNQTLDPTGYATRAEVAQMLYNFSKVI